jgi:HSP20 family protein
MKETKNITLKKSEPKKSKEIKEEGSKKISELKTEAEKNKETAKTYADELKVASSKKSHDIKEELKDIKDEATRKKDKLVEESESEGVHPAEKVVGDIISKFKQGTEQLNEIMTDYTKDTKFKKNLEVPLVDMLDTKEELVLIADIPGVKKDEINLGISKDCVEIEVKYKEKPEIKDSKFIINERSYGIKKRKIPIKSDINLKKASAKWEESKLTITLPKNHSEPEKISIE